MINLQKLVALAAVIFWSCQLSAAEWRKASDWRGIAVVTEAGDSVGQVEDFALDLESGAVNYVVISVGSFLIKDALIAVAPGALRLDATRLVIAADSVASASRFGEDSWPEQPDVVASNRPEGVATDASPAAASPPRSGVATISSNRRTATLSADERRIEDVQTPRPSQDGSTSVITRVPNGPLPSFGELDKNRNGVLSRREIGSWLGRGEGYDAVDLDSSGTVDRFEFDIFSAERK